MSEHKKPEINRMPDNSSFSTLDQFGGAARPAVVTKPTGAEALTPDMKIEPRYTDVLKYHCSCGQVVLQEPRIDPEGTALASLRDLHLKFFRDHVAPIGPATAEDLVMYADTRRGRR